MNNLKQTTLAIVLFLLPISSWSQKVELNEEVVEVVPVQDVKTGKGAARKFFTQEPDALSTSSSTNTERYLQLGFTVFLDSEAYRWGPSHFEDPAKWGLGVTYRFGEWTNSMDFLVRIDYQYYDLDSDKNPQKLSFVPLIVFPDARSGFPLYFGLGVGPGVFLKQVKDESRLSLDYQLFVGFRMFNLIQNAGIFLESGLKNHFHLLSSGQLNSAYVTLGTLFTF